MEGSVSDILVGSGEGVYLKQVCFDKQLQRRRAGRHLYATYHYLDDSEHHRTHYVLGTGDFSRTPVSYPWIATNNLAVPYGLMLAFDDKTVWGVHRGGATRPPRSGWASCASTGSPSGRGSCPTRRARS